MNNDESFYYIGSIIIFPKQKTVSECSGSATQDQMPQLLNHRNSYLLPLKKRFNSFFWCCSSVKYDS